MPLTLQQKQEMLRSKGYDPSRYFFEEDTGDIYEGQDPSENLQPSENISAPRVDNSPETSATTVFAKTFVTNLAPTAGAFGAGTLGFKVPGPLPVKILAGLGTSLAGGAAVSKLQEQILPPSLYPTPQEQTEHPYAALAGQVAPSLIALDPIESIKSLGRAGSTIGKRLLSPAGYAAPMASEMAALRNFGLNTGVNVGTQAGLNVMNQLRSDEPFSYGSLARDAALGLLLNEPTKIGTKLFGFQPSYRGVKTEADILAGRPGLADYTRPAPEVEPSALDKELASAYGTEFNEPAYQLSFKAKNEKGDYLVGDKETRSIFKREYPEIYKRALVEGKGLTPNQEVKLTTEQMRDFLDDVMKSRTELGEEFEPLAITPKQGIIGQEPSFYSRPPIKGKAVEIQQRSDTGAPYKYAQGVEPPTVTEQAAEKLLDKILRRRGLKLGQYGKGQILDTKGNVILGSKGKPVAGRALPAQRTIDIASKTAPDIAQHEAFHVQLSDLATSLDPRDRELVSRVFKEAGRPDLTAEEFVRLNTEEAKAMAEGRNEDAARIREQYIGVEEDLASFMGMEGAKRELQGGVKQWLKDFGSRFGVGERPARQQLSARQKYEAPYGTRGVEREVIGTEKMAEPPIGDKEYQATWDNWEAHAALIGKTIRPNESFDQQMKIGKSAIEAIAKKDPLGDKIINLMAEKGVIKATEMENFRKTVSSLASNLRESNFGSRYSEEPSKYVPEVARENKTGSIKNKLGHYLGTSYHGTPEDYARYNEIQKELSGLKAKGLSLASPEGQALYKENEAIKNKYGGMPPYPPKEQYATSKVSDERSVLQERQQGDARRQTKEASTSDSLQQSTKIQERKIGYDETTRQDINEPQRSEDTKLKESGISRSEEGIRGKEGQQGQEPGKMSEEESKYKIPDFRNEKWDEGIPAKGTIKKARSPDFPSYHNITDNEYYNRSDAYNKEANITGTKIQEQLGEASFKAAQKVQALQRVPRRAVIEDISAIAHDIFNQGKDEGWSFEESQDLAKAFIGFDGPEIQARAESHTSAIFGDEFASELKAKAERLNLKTGERLQESERNLREAFTKANFKAQEGEAFNRPDVERHAEEESAYQRVETFEPALAKELRKEHPFGLIPLRSDKSMSGNYIADKLPKILPKIEIELLKQAGFEGWLREKGKRVSSEEIANWLKENGPRIEVHSYGMEGKVSETKREYDRMTHELETQRGSPGMKEWAQAIDYASTQGDLDSIKTQMANERFGSYTPKERNTIAKYIDLKRAIINEPHDTSPRATSAYEQVSAFPTSEKMPEWTASKEGKNVQRVDVVIPHKEVPDTSLEAMPGETRQIGVKWQPDNLHENLPNTLGWAMIQYKTGPKGEKIAVIVEAQSRWGQQNREFHHARNNLNSGGTEPYLPNPTAEHPLLKDYNRLILKAAIDQARKEGADHIVISDAETAMMTEGHDLARPAYNFPNTEKNVALAKDLEYKGFPNLQDKLTHAELQKFPRPSVIRAAKGNPIEGISIEAASVLEKLGFEGLNRTKLGQEPGMRLNYDTILPKIAEELTGSKGEKVSLGEHKNAFDGSNYESPNGDLLPRQNLIFKNPDGTPKTDVSGVMYPIKEVAAKLQKEPFSLAGQKFSEEESIYTKDPNLLPKKPIFSLTTSVTDKIAEGKRGSYVHEKVSSRLRNYFNTANQKQGEYGQSIVKEYENYSPEEVNNVYRYRWEKDNGETTSRSLTPKEEELNRAYQTIIQRPKEDAATLGLKVKRGESYAIGGVKPEGYLPNVIDPDKLWLINERPNSVEAKSYKRQWKEWIVKKGGSAKEADELVENYFRAQRQYGDTGGPEFNALRKAEGYGLPWELMDKNPVRAALRYGRRAANDISFFEHIQSDPEMQKALGVKDQYGNNPEGMEKIDPIGTEKAVQDAMSFIWGKQEVANPRFSALMRFAGNLVMGHGTAIRNLAALPTQLAPYDVRLRDVAKGLMNLSESRRRAYESGAARINTAEFEYLGEMGNPDPVVRTLDKMSNFLRKYQGRNLSDKMEGELLYGIGEEWAKNQLAEGNIDMLKRASGKADYKIPEKPTSKDISELAAGFVRLTRGDYGPTGLPVWALKGNVAPFVALNRFGIEKWNNVVKDVIQPMKQGNLMPFLKYTLSGILTGAMIEEINEMLSGKKGSDLNVNETLAAYAETQDPELLAHKIIGLMQLSSYGGLMGDMAKMASRASQGKEISYSNPIGMPLYTLVTETFGENLSAAIGALRSGEDPINVFAEFAKTVPFQTIQATRYAKSRLDEDSGRKEAYRDIRLYKEATGKASREELKASKGNPYQDIEAKKFKKTEDITEAARMLPTLLQAAIKRAGNDPYKLKSEFQKLKANNFQVMPSIETQPFEFYKYVTYLRKSQGEEKAGERVAKFFLQREVNKTKSSLVP